jgi:endonuclease/exonuclease/phosphatase (EEP) superfamily protein YafD
MPISDEPFADTGPTRPAPRPSRRRAPLTTAMCALYVLLIIAVLVVMRLMGEQWWVATLLLFSPRWVWALPTIVLLPMAVLYHRRLAFPVALAAATVLFSVMGFRIPWRRALPAGTPHETLRVFTCNLHGRSAKPTLLEELVGESRPDVILLQDYTAAREPSIVRAEQWYSDRYDGTFIASRYPLHRMENMLPRDGSALAYASHGWPLGDAICYTLELPGGPIHLINLHLASPHQQLDAIEERKDGASDALDADSARRTFESLMIAARAQQIGGPFVIAGDFNTPDDSPLFGEAWHNFDDAFNTAGFGFGTTYSNHHTWLRIDHILCNPTWRCAACWVGPPIGSGHRPVVAVLEH